MKTVIYLPTIYRHESRDEITARLKLTVSGTTDCQVVQQFGNLPVGATIVVDSIHRLGDTADRAASALVKILELGEFWIPNTMLDLRRSNPNRDSLLQLIVLFANVKRSIKSARIRESLYIKSQLNGGAIHDSGISHELKQMVVRQFNQTPRVRETARVLTAMGFPISPSSVSRILRLVKPNE